MRREMGMLAALILMCAALWYSNPTFLGPGNVLNTSREISRLGIYAVGVGIVIITGGIDLSIGSLIGLTGVIVAKLSSPATDLPDYLHYPMWVGISTALGVAVLLGFFQGWLITALGLQPFIVTLGGMLLFRGIAQVITNGGTLSFGDSHLPPNMESSLITWHGWTIVSTPLLIFVVVLVIAAYLLHFSVFGRYLYAIGGSRDAAEYSGISVKRVEMMTYVISATCAGLAGICETYVGSMMHTNGLAYELYAIAAVVIGGVSLRGGEGTVVGMLIGCGIIRVIRNGINLFKFNYHDAAGAAQEYRLGSNWNDVIIGSVILIAVILDQLVHIAQAKRRTRKAAEIAATKQRGFDVVTTGSGTPGDSA
jgi:ribose transport system permease protein